MTLTYSELNRVSSSSEAAHKWPVTSKSPGMSKLHRRERFPSSSMLFRSYFVARESSDWALLFPEMSLEAWESTEHLFLNSRTLLPNAAREPASSSYLSMAVLISDLIATFTSALFGRVRVNFFNMRLYILELHTLRVGHGPRDSYDVFREKEMKP